MFLSNHTRQKLVPIIGALVFFSACQQGSSPTAVNRGDKTQKIKCELDSSSDQGLRCPEEIEVAISINEGSADTLNAVSFERALCDKSEPISSVGASRSLSDYPLARGNRSALLQSIESQGLSQEGAVQLALINNPDLFAYYQNLEIGYAGLIEAGLRENPVFSRNARESRDGELKVDEFEIAYNFLDAFLIPLRKNAAQAELSVIEAQVGQKILDLVREVKLSWAMVLSLEEKLAEEKKLLELKEIAAGLSVAQKNAGNISKFSSMDREFSYAEAKEKIKNSEADLNAAYERLGRALGLVGPETCFSLSGEIEWQGAVATPSVSEMEAAALNNRWDIEKIRREIYAIAAEAELDQPWTYTNLMVGQARESEQDGGTRGPLIELELPVFNFGQAERIKNGALIAQAQQELLAKAIEASSQVREFLDLRTKYLSQLESFENKLLPDLKEKSRLGQTHFNAMTIGVFDLLELKEHEIEAKIEQIDARMKFAAAHIDLLHALGGSFTELRRTR